MAIAAAEPEDITFYDAGGQAITNVFPVLNAAGSGYAVGDLLTVSGGSGMELQVTALGTNNAVAAFNVVSLGSGYTAANGGATAGGKGTGCTVNVSDTPVSLTVNEVKSVDIATTTGTVIFNATGNVNVGTLGGFNLESVNAGGEARIQAQSGLVDVRGDTNPVIVAGGNAILEGGNNGIGTSSVPIYVALSTGSLSASAANDIYITATEYDLRLVDIYSNANVYLTADGTGSIFDDNPNSAAAGVWEIGGQSAFLQAGGSIGTSSNYVATDLGQSGKVTATAGQNIYLHQVSGNMNVAAADSTNGGNIGLWAAVNLYDANGTVAPVAIGNNITLEADSGVINKASGGVAVGFAIHASGNLTSLSSLNTYVTETTGNLSLNTVQTQAGTAFISAPAGEILNGTGNTNITSGETYLFASGDIGTQANPIKAQTPSGSIAAIVQGASTAGSIYLDNEGALDLSNSVTGSGYGMQAGGGVYVNTDCPLEISSDVFAQGDIVKQAGTSLGETNSDLTVDPGVTIQSANGYVSLIAGTAVILEGSSSQITTIASNASYVSIVAGTNVTVQPDVVIAAGYTGKNSSTNVTIQGDAYTSGSTTYLNYRRRYHRHQADDNRRPRQRRNKPDQRTGGHAHRDRCRKRQRYDRHRQQGHNHQHGRRRKHDRRCLDDKRPGRHEYDQHRRLGRYGGADGHPHLHHPHRPRHAGQHHLRHNRIPEHQPRRRPRHLHHLIHGRRDEPLHGRRIEHSVRNRDRQQHNDLRPEHDRSDKRGLGSGLYLRQRLHKPYQRPPHCLGRQRRRCAQRQQ